MIKFLMQQENQKIQIIHISKFDLITFWIWFLMRSVEQREEYIRNNKEEYETYKRVTDLVTKEKLS